MGVAAGVLVALKPEYLPPAPSSLLVRGRGNEGIAPGGRVVSLGVGRDGNVVDVPPVAMKIFLKILLEIF